MAPPGPRNRGSEEKEPNVDSLKGCFCQLGGLSCNFAVASGNSVATHRAKVKTLSAMAGAVQHAEILLPRSDRIGVLPGHGPRDLVEVRKVVRYPSCQELRECNHSQIWMATPTRKILGLKLQRP